MSKLLCIIDGMTDADFRVADYPNLSGMRLARYVDTTGSEPPESLGCILRILGVRRVPAYFRAYVEALGHEIPVGSHELVLRGSWYRLDAHGCCAAVTDAPLALPKSPAYRYYPIGQYKSIFVFPEMAGFVADLTTYPPYACAALPAQSLRPTGCAAVSRTFDALLTPERCMIPWGQAVSATLPPLPHRAAMVCGTGVVRGIARATGMRLCPVHGATGDVDTDLYEKCRVALLAARTEPLVVLHINGADEASHRRDPAQKREFLQKVDEIVLTMLLYSGHEVYLLADHGTDPHTGLHLPGRQPLFTNVPAVTAKRTAAPVKSSAAPLERAAALQLLQKRAQQLGRLPQKGDFGAVEVIRIKRALGPWPRALEQAGLKQKKL